MKIEKLLEHISLDDIALYRAVTMDHVDRGMLPSEIAVICSVLKAEKIRLVLESGRWMGHSTLCLSRYLGLVGGRVDSVDRIRGEHSVRCAERLRNFRNVRCRFGDAFRVLPAVASWADEDAILVVDGPKGRAAVDLIRRVFEINPRVRAAFLHDCYKGSEARTALVEAFPGAQFSDDQRILDCFGTLDSGIAVGEFHPEQYHGDLGRKADSNKSYGPTLGWVENENSIRRGCGIGGVLSFAVETGTRFVKDALKRPKETFGIL